MSKDRKNRNLSVTNSSKLRDIVRLNIQSIRDLADALLRTKEKLLATEETIAELLHRIEKLEGHQSPATADGLKMYAVSGQDRISGSTVIPDLDVDIDDLPSLILQHPSWLRPFSILAEIEKHQLDGETLRLRRAPSGYLRVIRLTNGTEWGYFETISRDRFKRLPLLGQLFESTVQGDDWASAWVEQPVKLQSLQKGVRWEILVQGKLLAESER